MAINWVMTNSVRDEIIHGIELLGIRDLQVLFLQLHFRLSEMKEIEELQRRLNLILINLKTLCKYFA